MNAFEQLLYGQRAVNVIAASSYAPVVISAENQALAQIDTTDATAFEAFIDAHLSHHNAEAAFGGYKELRNIYRRSAIFNDDAAPERNIHIGLDLWIKAGTPVFAALDGTVHSFAYNTGLGDYGPTIILQHQLNGVEFFTLYGHLAAESIEALEIGDTFAKGAQIGTLGDAAVNGDYAPHLHFQIIKDIGAFFGDYPGVCTAQDLAYYEQNCPNPELLLKLNTYK